MEICAKLCGARGTVNRLGFVQVLSDVRRLVEKELTLVGSCPPNMQTYKKGELSGEFRGDCAHYWFSGTEEVHLEEGVKLL